LRILPVQFFIVTVKHFVPAILWFVISVILLCLPGSSLPKNSWLTDIHADKWVHIGLFSMLCYLFARPLRKSGFSAGKRRNYFFLILVFGICYGTLMEFVQQNWIPNRSFELADIGADSAGCLLGYFFSRWKFSGEAWKKIGPDGNRDRNQN
jgi:VanZ family protein